MLNGGGGLNPDGLSLDLQFAADKTLTARRGPTPSFSRASSGTFVNANGLIVGKTAGTTSSITPSTQAIGSQVTVTVASGSVVGWVVGQAISLIVDTDGQDDPDATELWLLGNIVSTTGTTLVFEVTSRTAQAGSATSWTLGYRGPRFDHTAAGVCRGLLIEESRTNSLKFSENLTNTTNWSASNQTVTLADVGPDGITNSAAVLNEGTAFGPHSVRGVFVQNRPVMGAVSCTLSAFFKAGTRRYILFAATDAGANGVAMTIDTQTWSVTDAKAIGTGITYTTNRLTNYGGGWYRAELTFTPSAATTVTPIIWGTALSTFTALDPQYTGTSSTIIAYGVQLEAGSFATSYIPTVASTVVRSADVCSITGANFNSIWNAAEGTMLSIGDSFGSAFAFYTYLTAQGSPSTSNVFMANFGATAVVIQKDTPQAFKSEATIPDATLKKLAYSYTSGSTSSSAINGAIPTPSTNNSTASVASASSFDIGFVSTSRLNGHIAAIRYYRKRFSNAKLAQLTV